jgi:hypothetical protein
VSSCENVCAVSTILGKPSGRARAADYAGRPIPQVLDPQESSAIVRRKDPGYLGIACSIYYQKIRNALCDLCVSVNLMSKAMFERLDIPLLPQPRGQFNLLMPQSGVRRGLWRVY